jgi:ABC-type glycerol-3-phosphate transport system permease component
MTSLKPAFAAWQIPPQWLFKPTFENYLKVFKGVRESYGMTGVPFSKALINSLIISLMSVFFALLMALFAAYAFARFQFKSKNQLAYWILSTRMFPPIAAVIPWFLIAQKLKIMDTWIILIIIYTGMNLAFCTWVLRGFLQDLPQEIEEAALVDGCSRFRVLTRIVIPVCAPSIVSTGILALIFAWNEFLFALILTGSRAKTLPVYATGYILEKGIAWAELSAVAILIALPMIVFGILIQRYLIRGLTLGAIK